VGRNVSFDQVRYTRDLKRQISGVLDNVSKNVYRHALHNLASLKVRKVDEEHVHTFPHALKMTNNSTADRFVTHFGMSNNRPNQSFRALYYEYGTGENMRPPGIWSPSNEMNNWNPVRPKQVGAPIYYRGGKWQDLGGNWHKGGVRPGIKKRIPRKNIYGHPVRAQFWFRKALIEGTRGLDELVLRAVKAVPVTAYIKIRDVRVRM
jgi:hypothetical protein